jgi:hypothetical protein
MPKIINTKTLAVIAMVLLLLLCTSCGGASSANTSANTSADAIPLPVQGAVLNGQISTEYPFDTGQYKVYLDGVINREVQAHTVADISGSGSPKLLKEGEQWRLYPYILSNYGGNLLVWQVPVCETYTYTDQGQNMILEMYEGDTNYASQHLPQTYWQATCTQGKIKIVTASASPDCKPETITWDDRGAWHCTATNGIDARIDPPEPSWPQGSPKGG